MKTYVISTEYILSEFYAGVMAGIIQAIAGNYVIEPEKDKDRNHNLFIFKASKEDKDKILEIAKTVFGEYCYEVSEVGGENESDFDGSDYKPISVEGRVNDSMVLQEMLKNDE